MCEFHIKLQNVKFIPSKALMCEFHTKLQTVKFIPDVYQNKFVSERAHSHLQTLGECNPATENRGLHYKMRQTFEGT